LTKRKLTIENDEPLVRGVTAAEPMIDEEEVYRRAVIEWHKTERLHQRQTAQKIQFKQSPIAL